MLLDAGNGERISSPTAEQVRHHLRFLSLEAARPKPIVLSDTDGASVRAAAQHGEYRVEYRLDEDQFFAIVPFEQAAAILEKFLRRDASYRHAAAWRRLTPLSEPWLNVSLPVAAAVALGLIACVLWVFLGP